MSTGKIETTMGPDEPDNIVVIVRRLREGTAHDERVIRHPFSHISGEHPKLRNATIQQKVASATEELLALP